MLTSIFVTGLGGQGVVTFARLVTGYLIEQGLKTSLFNATGMAQRGGRVTSEIRISSDPELQYGSRIPAGKADILVGLEIGEAANSLSFLKSGGTVILLDYAFVPTVMPKKQAYPSFDQVRELFTHIAGSVFAVTEPEVPYNIYLLGVFAAVLAEMPGAPLDIACEGLKSAISKNLKRGIEENLKVFEQGCSHGRRLAGS